MREGYLFEEEAVQGVCGICGEKEVIFAVQSAETVEQVGGVCSLCLQHVNSSIF